MKTKWKKRLAALAMIFTLLVGVGGNVAMAAGTPASDNRYNLPTGTDAQGHTTYSHSEEKTNSSKNVKPIKTSGFTSFSSLMKSMGKGGFNGDIKDPQKQKAALWFYNHWGHYLRPERAYIAFISGFAGGIAKQLYGFTKGLEDVYTSLFKLFGLFGYIDKNDNSLLGTLYGAMQKIGISLFVVLLIIYALIHMTGKKAKYEMVFLRLLLSLFVIGVLPWGLQTFSNALQSDVTTMVEGNRQPNSLALQPIKNNTVDLLDLANNDFRESTPKGSKAKSFEMTGNGDLKSVQKANSITDDTNQRNDANYVDNVDFGATLGVTDTTLGDKLDKQQDGLKGLFEHFPNASGTGVNAADEHRFVKASNTFEKVYTRYRVNWFGVYAQYIVLIVLLLSMGLKLVKSIFEITLTSVVAPLAILSELEGTKRIKEVLGTIVGALAGTFFEVITLNVMFEVMRDLPQLEVFSGLNSWETVVATIMIYLGLFFGAMQGITIVERWLGVSTGHNDSMQQMVGGAMLAGATISGAKGVANLGAGMGRTAIKGTGKVPGLAKQAGRSIASSVGVGKGAMDRVKQQGIGRATQSGIHNVMKNAANGIGNKKDEVAGKMKGAYGKGVDQGHAALKNNNPTIGDIRAGRVDYAKADPKKPTVYHPTGKRSDLTEEGLKKQPFDQYNHVKGNRVMNPDVNKSLKGGIAGAGKHDGKRTPTQAPTPSDNSVNKGISGNTESSISSTNEQGGISPSSMNNEVEESNSKQSEKQSNLSNQGGLKSNKPSRYQRAVRDFSSANSQMNRAMQYMSQSSHIKGKDYSK